MEARLWVVDLPLPMKIYYKVSAFPEREKKEKDTKNFNKEMSKNIRTGDTQRHLSHLILAF